MVSRVGSSVTGVPLPRRDPVRVVVQSSYHDHTENNGHNNNNTNGNGGMNDDYSDDDHDGRSAAAVMWIWHQQWTKRVILVVLAIIIIVAMIQLTKSPSSSSLSTSSSVSSGRASSSSSSSNELFGGPPSWRQRRQKSTLRSPSPVTRPRHDDNNNDDKNDNGDGYTNTNTNANDDDNQRLIAKPIATPAFRTRPPRRRASMNATIPLQQQQQQQAEEIPPVVSVTSEHDHDKNNERLIPSPTQDDNNNGNGNNGSRMLNDTVRTFAALPFGARCLNSVQGVYHVTDSSGAICHRRSLLSNGCCDRSHTLDLLSCHGCRNELKCCDSFEYCASCCLASRSSLSSPSSLLTVPLSPLDVIFENDIFEQCLHLCRTSSRSLKGGNQYRTNYRHCYTDGQSIGALNMTAAKIVTADIGASCSDACSTIDRTCYEHYLPEINTCDMMKKHFPCEKGCENNSGSDQPAYVPPEAPLGTVGQCLVNNDPNLFDCSGYHQYTRRLCVCV